MEDDSATMRGAGAVIAMGDQMQLSAACGAEVFLAPRPSVAKYAPGEARERKRSD